MLDLANRFWDWRAVKLEVQRIKNEEKANLAIARKKYGLYMDKAKRCSDKALYSECPDLTKVFEDCIESGVTESKTDAHWCYAKFGNGWTVKFWIANRMYAYARGAEFVNSEGKEVKYGSHSMPQFFMCFVIEDKVEKIPKKS